jgi:hypothetical protein
MHYHRLLFIALLAISIPFADELIDDFECGVNKNRFDHYWYYFSDVKDGGKSLILNAEILSNGSYSSLEPVKEGQDSGYCVKLEYLLGDTFKDKESYNFTGIGTDIAREGGTADIQPAYGVSFKARGTCQTSFIFELVTSNIYDNGYFCSEICDITNEWKTFTINFDVLEQPPWAKETDLLLSKVQKMNWKVTRYRGEHQYLKDGCIYLDDIVLLNNAAGTRKLTLKQEIKNTGNMNIMGDLLGRRIKIFDHANQASGIYVMPNRKNLNLNRTGNVPKK